MSGNGAPPLPHAVTRVRVGVILDVTVDAGAASTPAVERVHAAIIAAVKGMTDADGLEVRELVAKAYGVGPPRGWASPQADGPGDHITPAIRVRT